MTIEEQLTASMKALTKLQDKNAELKQPIETTIPCLEGTFLGGKCCGCLTANYEKNSWIFRCNECGKEWGRGK